MPDDRCKRRRRGNAAVRVGWMEVLRERKWDHFATLTTKNPADRSNLADAFGKAFLRRLTRIAQRRIGAYMVTEGDGDYRRLHLHALLYGTEAIPCHRIEELWKLGQAKVERFDPRRDWAAYLTKDILIDTDAADILFYELPRLRQRQGESQ